MSGEKRLQSGVRRAAKIERDVNAGAFVVVISEKGRKKRRWLLELGFGESCVSVRRPVDGL